jgi:ABC-type nitrate/sulfonate/bicarbonate transport system ATPase subunit
VEMERVSFAYSAVSNGALYSGFSLRIAPGSIVAIMGASGCGKSTLARLLAGILAPQAGMVRWSDELRARSAVVYVDQHPMNSLFPWQRVRANIEYPLGKLGWDPTDTRDRLAYLLTLFRLEAMQQSYPANLSGGELQRVALARCLSWRPRLVVLDEPFSALDGKVKEEIAGALRELAGRDRITLVLVTHNVTDALAMATRCVVIGHRPVDIIADQEFAACAEAPAPDRAAMQRVLINSIRHGLV